MLDFAGYCCDLPGLCLDLLLLLDKRIWKQVTSEGLFRGKRKKRINFILPW